MTLAITAARLMVSLARKPLRLLNSRWFDELAGVMW